MNMKTRFFKAGLLAAAVFGIVACNNSEMETGKTQSKDIFNTAGVGNVSFGVAESVSFTKSQIASDNNKIKHIQLFVFDKSGALIASKGKNFSTTTSATSSLASDTVQITVPLGVAGMRVFALANSESESEQWSSVKDTATLKKCISKLSSNSADCMSAIGDRDGLTFSRDSVYTVSVKRFGVKVILENITTAFVSSVHQGLDFKLEEIFLTNVQSECPYSQVPIDTNAAGWINKRGFVSSDVNDLVAETGLATDLKAGSDVRHYFYCYPNRTVKAADSHDTQGDFTVRRTRLVLKTSLGSETYYYPIDLPGSDTGKLESNKRYTITDLKITGIGVNDPETVLEKGSISCRITIQDWETGEIWSVEY